MGPNAGGCAVMSTCSRANENVTRAVTVPEEEELRHERLRLAGSALANFAAHVIGVAFADPVRRVAAIWPASGIGIAVLLSTRRRRWPLTLVVLGGVGFVTNVFLQHALAMSFGFFVANVAELSLGAWLVTRFIRRDVTFTHVDEVLALTGAAVAANTLVGVLGAGAPWLFAHAPFWPTYWTWWSTNVLGTILVAPLAIVWTRPREREQPSRRAETLLFGIAWCASVWMVTLATPIDGPFAPRWYMLLFSCPGPRSASACARSPRR